MSTQRRHRLFISYSRADEKLREELEKSLAAFRQQGLIEISHGLVPPGKEWRPARDQQFEQADIILLLISPDFIDSNYCVEVDLEQALHRHHAGAAYVVPILLRPTAGWEKLAIGKLQHLPRGGRPVREFKSRDDAWEEVGRELGGLFEKFSPTASMAKPTLEPPGGGYNAEWYVSRPSLQETIFDHLDTPATPAVLRGPELFGKSLLFHHVLAQVKRGAGTSVSSAKIVTIDFRVFTPDRWASPDTFYHVLAERLCSALGCGEGPLKAAWRGQRAPNLKLRRLLEDRLLPSLGGSTPLILAIDHADEICQRTPAESSLADDFFGLLRSLCDKARSEPGHTLGRLRLLVAISHSPTYLLRTSHSSLFNFTTDILLGDLDSAEIRRLASCHGTELSEEDLILLQRTVGGHPYLVRIALYRSVRSGQSLAACLRDPHHAIFDDYLRRIRVRLERSDLYAAARNLYENPQAQIESRIQELLRRAGLFMSDAAHASTYRLRYPIYEALFRN